MLRKARRAACSRRDLPLYEPGRAGETLLGELAVAGLVEGAEDAFRAAIVRDRSTGAVLVAGEIRREGV